MKFKLKFRRRSPIWTLSHLISSSTVSFVFIYLLSAITLLSHSCVSQLYQSHFFGGAINGQRVLTQSESPFFITSDIIIDEHAKLDIEPGCELKFAPRIGILVKGTLIAKVCASVC